MVGIKIGVNGFQKAEYSSTWIPICRNNENFKKANQKQQAEGKMRGTELDTTEAT